MYLCIDLSIYIDIYINTHTNKHTHTHTHTHIPRVSDEDEDGTVANKSSIPRTSCRFRGPRQPPQVPHTRAPLSNLIMLVSIKCLCSKVRVFVQ